MDNTYWLMDLKRQCDAVFEESRRVNEQLRAVRAQTNESRAQLREAIDEARKARHSFRVEQSPSG